MGQTGHICRLTCPRSSFSLRRMAQEVGISAGRCVAGQAEWSARIPPWHAPAGIIVGSDDRRRMQQFAAGAVPGHGWMSRQSTHKEGAPALDSC